MRLVAEIGTGTLAHARQAVAQLADISSGHNLAIEVKGQFLTPDTITTRDAPRYDRLGGKWRTQHGGFQNHLTYEQWGEVAGLCQEKNMYFFPSVFDHDAITAALAMGCDTLKIASGDITYHDLIRHAAQVAPSEIIISTGGATLDEVDSAIEVVASVGRPELRVILLACTLSYPASHANLARVLTLRQRYEPFGVLVGYSDHTTTWGAVRGLSERPVATPIGAATLGAAMWEFHYSPTGVGGGDHDFAYQRLTLNRALSDLKPVLAPGHLGLVNAHNLGRIVPQFGPIEEERAAVEGARRSLVAAVDIARGTRLTRDMVAVLRPGTGIPPYEIEMVVAGTRSDGTVSKGLTAMTDIPAGTVITRQMVGLAGGTLTVK